MNDNVILQVYNMHLSIFSTYKRKTNEELSFKGIYAFLRENYDNMVI